VKKQIKQRDKRTGRVYVYETDMEYDPASKKTLLRNRRLIGHVDDATGEVVANRPTRASLDSGRSTRLFVGATWLLDQAVDQLGLREDLEKALPGMAEAFLSLAYYLVCEDRSPMRRFHRWGATHAHPFGAPITSQQASALLTAGDETVQRNAVSAAVPAAQ